MRQLENSLKSWSLEVQGKAGLDIGSRLTDGSRGNRKPRLKFFNPPDLSDAREWQQRWCLLLVLPGSKYLQNLIKSKIYVTLK